MSNEVQFARQESGLDLYFVVRDPAGNVYNGASFVAIASVTWTSAAVTMTEQGSTGDYYGSFPSGVAAGQYTIEVFERVGSQRVRKDDVLLGQASGVWKGSRLLYGSQALGELVEDDAGVLRYTANTLEQGPAGGSGGSTAAEIADAVWGEALADHSGTAGSTAQRLSRLPAADAGTNGGLPTVDSNNRINGIQGTKNRLDNLVDLTAAAAADAVWDEASAGHAGANSMGERLLRIPNNAPGTAGGVPTVDSSNRVAGIVGVVSANVVQVGGSTAPTSAAGVLAVDAKYIANSNVAAQNLAEDFDADADLYIDNKPWLLAATTINSLTSQTVFRLALGDPNANAYVGHYALVTKASDTTQRAVRRITAYDGATRQVTLASAPGFSIVTGDRVAVLAATLTAAEVNAEVDAALADVNLDHLVGTATGIPSVPAGTFLDQALRDGVNPYDRTQHSLQAIRDRGDAAWTTGGGGGGGSLTDILHVTPIIPPSIDISAAPFRLALMLTNALDDLPSTAEITPGTISIDRKPFGGSSWTQVEVDAPCAEIAGLVYYDAVFDDVNPYQPGDSIRITFKGQLATIAANAYEITGAAGVSFYSSLRERMRGTDTAYTGTPPTVVQIRQEIDSNSTQLAAIKGDTAAILVDTGTAGVKLETDAVNSTSLATSAISEIQTGLSSLSASQIRAEVAGAIADVNLDHLVGTATAIPSVPSGTYLDQVMRDGTSGFDRATDSLQAIRDRGDAAWSSGMAAQMNATISWHPLIPPVIDLADTALWRLGIAVQNMIDVLPPTSQITPGTISIDRKAIGAAAWSAIATDVACLESAGLIYYDQAFGTAAGFARGDAIRITFRNQKLTIDGHDHEITGAVGTIYYTHISEVEPSVPTAIAIRQEIDANSTQLAAIVADTDELQTEWADGGRLDNLLDARAAGSALSALQLDVTTTKTNVAAILDDTGTSGVKLEPDAVKATTLAADAVDEITAGLADAVWDETRTGHNVAGTFGETITTLDQNIDNLDVPVSSVAGGGSPGTTNIVDDSRVWRVLENGLAANVLELQETFDGTLAFDLSELLNPNTALASAPTIALSPAIAGQPTSVTIDASKRRVHFDVDDLASGENYTISVTCLTTDSQQVAGEGQLHVR